MPSIQQLRSSARTRLRQAGFASPGVEADLLLAAMLGMRRGDIEIAALMGRGLDDQAAARVLTGLERRCRREPLQHIAGSAAFFGMDLAVGPGVFVPRPETERLAELAADAVSENPLGSNAQSPPIAVDLGAGSGAVGLAVAKAVPDARVVCIEASPEAWPWLVRNCRDHGAGRVDPRFGRMQDGRLWLGVHPSVIVSNPPYVPAASLPEEPEAHLFDPAEALYGGPDGLDVIRDIERIAAGRLGPGGVVLIEHDERLGRDVRDLFENAQWDGGETIDDLTGRDRFVRATRTDRPVGDAT